MDNNYEPNMSPDSWEYSLESILAEYSSEPEPETPRTPEEQRSREIVMEALGEQIAASETGSEDFPEETAQKKPRRGHFRARDERRARRNTSPRVEAQSAAPESEEFPVTDDVPEYVPEAAVEEAPAVTEQPVPEPEDYSLTEILAEVKAAEIAEKEAAARAQAAERAQAARIEATARAEAAKAAAEAAVILPEPVEEESVPDDAEKVSDDSNVETVTLETDGEDTADYAQAEYPEWEEDEAEDEADGAARTKSNRPNMLVTLVAALLIRRRQHKEKVRVESAAADEQEELPEVSVKSAAKYYIKSATPYKLRFMAAAILCLILLYISWGLPLVGAMKSIRVSAGMCLLLELSVMLLGLDIFTNGMAALMRGKPALESLVSISCICSALDAVIIMLGGPQHGLPYCAVSAIAMALALLGERMYCLGMARSLHTASAAAEPTAVSAEDGALPNSRVLIKGSRGTAGFVSRSQDTDPVSIAYSVIAPVLLVAAPILAFIATVCRKQAGDFFHCLSALTAVSSTFSALLCYTLPFASVAKRLASAGAAIAGWSGCADIGESHRTVVTDGDIFPAGNVLIDTIRILEGVYTDKVISYAGSVIAFSGCGLVPAFTDLMRRNGCAIHQVENFSCHRGGGLTAIVRGEQVFVGNSSFMNLMGIRLPQSQMAKTSVFVAISGELVGVFSVRYVPTAAVQEGLVRLLHSRSGAPLFAIRDFNVTPLLIKQRFRMPTEGFEFPSFPERYRISALSPENADRPAAVLVRKGLLPYVEAAHGGRALYNSVRVCLLLSLLGSVLGMLLMFFLCAGASYDSASVGNILLFMLLWLVPVIISAFGLRR